MKKNHDNVLHILDEYQEIVRQTRKAKIEKFLIGLKTKETFTAKRI